MPRVEDRVLCSCSYKGDGSLLGNVDNLLNFLLQLLSRIYESLITCCERYLSYLCHKKFVRPILQGKLLACCNCFVYDAKQVSVFEDLVVVATVMNSAVSTTLSQMLLSEAWKHGKK